MWYRTYLTHDQAPATIHALLGFLPQVGILLVSSIGSLVFSQMSRHTSHRMAQLGCDYDTAIQACGTVAIR
jgi:hypothetical protein